jgi:hypothetical protein
MKAFILVDRIWRTEMRFYTRFRISDLSYQRFYYYYDDNYKGGILQKKGMGELAENLVKRIFEIRGVTSIEISPYELKLTIAPAFSLSEVEIQVVDILQEAIPQEMEKEDIPLFADFKKKSLFQKLLDGF